MIFTRYHCAPEHKGQREFVVRLQRASKHGLRSIYRKEGEVSKGLFSKAKPTPDSMPLMLTGHTNTSFYGNGKVSFSKEFMEAAYMAMMQFKSNTHYGTV